MVVPGVKVWFDSGDEIVQVGGVGIQLGTIKLELVVLKVKAELPQYDKPPKLLSITVFDVQGKCPCQPLFFRALKALRSGRVLERMTKMRERIQLKEESDKEK